MRAHHIQANEWEVTLLGQNTGIRIIRFGTPRNSNRTFCGFQWIEIKDSRYAPYDVFEVA